MRSPLPKGREWCPKGQSCQCRHNDPYYGLKVNGLQPAGSGVKSRRQLVHGIESVGLTLSSVAPKGRPKLSEPGGSLRSELADEPSAPWEPAVSEGVGSFLSQPPARPLSHPSCIRILRPTAADRMHVMLALSGPRIAVGKRSPQRRCEVIDRLCWPRTRVRLGTALSGTSLPKRSTQAKSSRPQGMRALGRYQL